MKRVSKILAVVLLFALSSCGVNKMVKDAKDFQVNPNPMPLEYVAGKVPVSAEVVFPPKTFNKKAYVTVTVSLASDKDTVKLKDWNLRGEKVQATAVAISYESGKIFEPKDKAGMAPVYSDTIDYNPDLRLVDLLLEMKICKGTTSSKCKTVKFDSARIGIVTTPLLVYNGLTVDNPALDGKGLLMTKDIVLTGKPQPKEGKEKVVLYYPLQQSRLPYKEQKKAEVDSFFAKFNQYKADPDIQILGVDVASYASPDGPIPLNHDLVKGRANTAEKFIGKKIKETDLLKRETTPDEDWEGFKEAVQKSNIEDKDLILRVLSMYSDPNVREKEIKKMAKVYDQLRKEILPKLRRAEIQAVYKEREKTTEEIIAFAKTNPDRLSQQELFFAAQEAPVSDKEVIYKEYVKRYPNDMKGFNNLGVYYIKKGDYAAAEDALNKALSLNSNDPTVLNNLGVLAYAKGNEEKAKEYFNKAENLSSGDAAINYNKGFFCVLNAKYNDAVTRFGSKATFNKALAELLSGDAAKAKATLESVKDNQNAYYFYLMAVIEARIGDNEKVLENLQKAIDMDASLKAYAKEDIEFRNLFDDSKFKSLVE